MRIDIDPQGYVLCQGQKWRCALGRGGVRPEKFEGDGVTPAGTWALGRVFYRADRVNVPKTALNTVPLQPTHGWCDDPDHADYNHLITLPHPARHEELWREEAVYDVIVEILYNTDPVQPGLGSAIFMHVAKPGYTPTEGCIALEFQDLFDLLQLCNEDTVVQIPA